MRSCPAVMLSLNLNKYLQSSSTDPDGSFLDDEVRDQHTVSKIFDQVII